MEHTDGNALWSILQIHSYLIAMFSHTLEFYHFTDTNTDFITKTTVTARLAQARPTMPCILTNNNISTSQTLTRISQEQMMSKDSKLDL